MTVEYIERRIKALESELQSLKSKEATGALSKEEIARRIVQHRNLAERISRSLKVDVDPDTYLEMLRAKE